MRIILVSMIAILLLAQVVSSQMMQVGDVNVAKAMRPACMTTNEIYNEMRACKAQGQEYQIFFDENRCKQIRCIGAKEPKTCPDASILDTNVQGCKRKNLEYMYYTDPFGCRQVRCLDEKKTCPAAYDLNKAMESCRASGKEFQYYADNYGCRQIRCIEPVQTTVMCKKTMSGNCVLINCEDGYQFNSCNYSRLGK